VRRVALRGPLDLAACEVECDDVGTGVDCEIWNCKPVMSADGNGVITLGGTGGEG